jgi:large subunit ribosomal protein L4e
MNMNHRQAHGVARLAGHQTSAISWGTGRAVARIPRVPGGGTSRSGQGAYGNMCRGGHMFSPKKVWRRIHRPINLTLKRHAAAIALAASACPAIVTARGHHIHSVKEFPLVVGAQEFSTIKKTKQAITFLKGIGAYHDVQRCIDGKSIRAGKGKMRGRKYRVPKGPLIIYKGESSLIKAFRNIPGVDSCSVERLNLLQLAPGGHLGRFIIWTDEAFDYCKQLFGSYGGTSTIKKGYRLLRPLMTNPDIQKIIRSKEVQKVLRDKRTIKSLPKRQNPYKHLHVMKKLNPAFVKRTKEEIIKQKEDWKKKKAEKKKKMRKKKK